MAKQEMARHQQKENINEKGQIRRQDGQPTNKHAQTPELDSPFRPRMEEHASLLAEAGSREHLAGLAMQLQRTYGNRYVRRLFKQHSVKAKLRVSDPDDVSEREADVVAEKVVREVNSQNRRQANEEAIAKTASEVQRQAGDEEEELQGKLQRQAGDEEEELQGKLQRQAGDEEEELQGKLQRQAGDEEEEEVQTQTFLHKAALDTPSAIGSDLELRINAARGGGQPLEGSILSPMEQTFGADFSQVRVHTDSNADNLSQELQARAFTTGNDIFFKNGEYDAGSTAGRRLLAHELTHTIQQGRASAAPRVRGQRSPAKVVQRDKADFEQKKESLEKFFAEKEKEKKKQQPTGNTTETGTTGEKETEKEKVEEPYQNKPSAGMNRIVYDEALLKFKAMKKPRIAGGLSKSMRKIKATEYLRETVEASKIYTVHSQTIVNSVMQAYQDTFGEELKAEAAPEKLAGKAEESKWQKFKTFVSGVMHIGKWVGWVKKFIEFCKSPMEAVADKAATTLPQFLSFAQPIANQVAAWTKWIPIVGIVSSFFGLVMGIKEAWTKGNDMRALKSAAKSAQEKKDTASTDLTKAAQYGYAKVRRGFWTQFYNVMKSVAGIILGVAKLVVGMFTAGLGAIIIQGADLAVTLIDLVNVAFRKIKGIGKWILGKRGKARRENAEKIVMSARQGSKEAMALILKLDPSGIARGDKLDKFWYWLKYWGASKKDQDVKMLEGLLNDWNKEEVNTLVAGVAEKLKSQ